MVVVFDVCTTVVWERQGLSGGGVRGIPGTIFSLLNKTFAHFWLIWV